MTGARERNRDYERIPRQPRCPVSLLRADKHGAIQLV